MDISTKTAYDVLQCNCGIKCGDKVKVLRKAIDFELGWEQVWEPGMNDTVGKTLQVQKIYSVMGIQLSNNKYYPFFVLEKIESPARPTPRAGDIVSHPESGAKRLIVTVCGELFSINQWGTWTLGEEEVKEFYADGRYKKIGSLLDGDQF